MNNIMEKINTFREDRDWKQFHNAKDLTISISLEASELLELFQWKSSEEAIEKNTDRIKEELADVLIYSLMLSHDLNFDVEEIIEKKIKTNEKKYPIHKFKGLKLKSNELRGLENE